MPLLDKRGTVLGIYFKCWGCVGYYWICFDVVRYRLWRRSSSLTLEVIQLCLITA